MRGFAKLSLLSAILLIFLIGIIGAATNVDITLISPSEGSTVANASVTFAFNTSSENSLVGTNCRLDSNCSIGQAYSLLSDPVNASEGTNYILGTWFANGSCNWNVVCSGPDIMASSSSAINVSFTGAEATGFQNQSFNLKTHENMAKIPFVSSSFDLRGGNYDLSGNASEIDENSLSFNLAEGGYTDDWDSDAGQEFYLKMNESQRKMKFYINWSANFPRYYVVDIDDNEETGFGGWDVLMAFNPYEGGVGPVPIVACANSSVVGGDGPAVTPITSGQTCSNTNFTGFSSRNVTIYFQNDAASNATVAVFVFDEPISEQLIAWTFDGFFWPETYFTNYSVGLNGLKDERYYSDDWESSSDALFRVLANDSTNQLQIYSVATNYFAGLYLFDIDGNTSTGSNASAPWAPLGTDMLLAVNSNSSDTGEQGPGFGSVFICWNSTATGGGDSSGDFSEPTQFCNSSSNNGMQKNVSIENVTNNDAANNVTTIEAILSITGAWVSQKISKAQFVGADQPPSVTGYTLFTNGSTTETPAQEITFLDDFTDDFYGLTINDARYSVFDMGLTTRQDDRLIVEGSGVDNAGGLLTIDRVNESTSFLVSANVSVDNNTELVGSNEAAALLMVYSGSDDEALAQCELFKNSSGIFLNARAPDAVPDNTTMVSTNSGLFELSYSADTHNFTCSFDGQTVSTVNLSSGFNYSLLLAGETGGPGINVSFDDLSFSFTSSSVPSLESVSISPSNPSTADNLTASYAGLYAGAGSDWGNVTFNWLVNNSETGGDFESLMEIYLRLYTNSSTIRDLSTNGFDGMITGAPELNANAELPGSLRFNSGSQYITINNSDNSDWWNFSDTYDFSLGLVFDVADDLDTSTGQAFIFLRATGPSNYFFVGIDQSDRLAVGWSNSTGGSVGVSTDSAIDFTRPHSMWLTYNREGTINLYLDGDLNDSVTADASTWINSDDGEMLLGSFASSTGSPDDVDFRGDILLFRIASGALSTEEMLALDEDNRLFDFSVLPSSFLSDGDEWAVIGTAFNSLGLVSSAEPVIFDSVTLSGGMSSPLSVILNEPNGESYANNTNVTFNYSVDGAGVTGCSIWTNQSGSWEQTAPNASSIALVPAYNYFYGNVSVSLMTAPTTVLDQLTAANATRWNYTLGSGYGIEYAYPSSLRINGTTSDGDFVDLVFANVIDTSQASIGASVLVNLTNTSSSLVGLNISTAYLTVGDFSERGGFGCLLALQSDGRYNFVLFANGSNAPASSAFVPDGVGNLSLSFDPYTGDLTCAFNGTSLTNDANYSSNSSLLSFGAGVEAMAESNGIGSVDAFFQNISLTYGGSWGVDSLPATILWNVNCSNSTGPVFGASNYSITIASTPAGPTDGNVSLSNYAVSAFSNYTINFSLTNTGNLSFIGIEFPFGFDLSAITGASGQGVEVLGGEIDSPDIARNNEFEDWTGFIEPTYWSNLGGNSGTDFLVIRNSSANSGNYAIQLNGTGQDYSGVMASPSGLTPGDSYNFSFYGKNNGSNSAPAVVAFYNTGENLNQLAYWWNWVSSAWDLAPFVDFSSNGGFEVWSDGRPDNWTDSAAGVGNPVFNEETTKVLSGSTSAVKIVTDGNVAGQLNQTIQFNSQSATNLSFWAAGAVGGENVSLFIVDGSGTQIWNFSVGDGGSRWISYAGGEPVPDALLTTTLTADYQPISTLFYAANGFANIFLVGSRGGGTVYLDNLTVLQQDNNPDMGTNFYVVSSLTDSYSQNTSPSITVPSTGGFYLIVAAGANDVLIDDAALRKNGTGANVLNNSGFEYWGFIEANATDWSWEITRSTGGTEDINFGTASSEFAFGGNYSAAISNYDPVALIQQADSPEAGKEYVATVWARRAESSGANGVFFALNDVIENATQIYNFSSGAWEAFGEAINEQNGACILEISSSFQQFSCPAVSIPASGKIYYGLMAGDNRYASYSEVYFDKFHFTPENESSTLILNVTNSSVRGADVQEGANLSITIENVINFLFPSNSGYNLTVHTALPDDSQFMGQFDVWFNLTEASNQQSLSVSLDTPGSIALNNHYLADFGFFASGNGITGCELWTNESGTFEVVAYNQSVISTSARNSITRELAVGVFPNQISWNINCSNSTASAFDSENNSFTVTPLLLSSFNDSFAGATINRSIYGVLNFGLTTSQDEAILVTGGAAGAFGGVHTIDIVNTSLAFAASVNVSVENASELAGGSDVFAGIYVVGVSDESGTDFARCDLLKNTSGYYLSALGQVEDNVTAVSSGTGLLELEYDNSSNLLTCRFAGQTVTGANESAPNANHSLALFGGLSDSGSTSISASFDNLSFAFTTEAGEPAVSVELNAPLGESEDNNTEISFNYSLTGTLAGLLSCSLWTNQSGTWESRASNTSGIAFDSPQYIVHNVSASLLPATIIWNVECINDSSSVWATSNATLFLNEQTEFLLESEDNMSSIKFWVNTPYGENNITITTSTDKVNYTGYAGSIYVNVTAAKSLHDNTTGADFLEYVSVDGLGSTIHIQHYVKDGFNCAGNWVQLQDDTTYYVFNNFSWYDNETKCFVSNYSILPGFNSIQKFMVINSLNFTPTILASASKTLHAFNVGACSSNGANNDCAVSFDGSLAGTGPMMMQTDCNPGGCAAAAGQRDYFASSLSAKVAEDSTYAYNIQGACRELYENNPAVFNDSNKVVTAGGYLYCFAPDGEGTPEIFTAIKVNSHSESTGGLGVLTAGSASLEMRTDGPPQFILPDLDPYFDTNLHNATVFVNTTSGAGASDGANVSVINSTNDVVVTGVANATGYVVFNELISEDYAFVAYGSNPAYFNKTTLVAFVGAPSNESVTIQDYDDAVPQVEFAATTNSSGSYNTNILINVTVADANLDRVIILLNGTAVQTCSASPCEYTISVDGSFNVSAWSNDTVGHSNSTSNLSFARSTTAPVIFVYRPQNTSYNSTVSLNYSIVDALFDSAWYSLNAGANTSLSGNTTLASVSGSNNVVVWANNSFGNTNSSATIFYYYDADIPSIEYSSLTYASGNYSVNPTINISVSDATGLNRTEIYVNGSLGATCGASAANCYYAIGGEGTYAIYGIVFDNANNSNTTAVRNYVIDATKPALRVYAPLNASTYVYANSTVYLNYSASDSNLLSVWYSLNGVNSTLSGNTTLAPAAGWNALTVHANDSAGNENATNTISFYYDATVPTLLHYSPNSPADIDTTNLFASSVAIIYNISDSNLNESSVLLWHKTNSTSSDCMEYVNGSAITCGYQSTTAVSNLSSNFTFSLFDRQVYPATYNLPERALELTSHSSYALGGQNEVIKIRLFNVSNAKGYSQFEINASNSSVSANVLRIYYCNSSYVSGSVITSTFCTNFYNLPRTSPFNHTHSAYSSHHIIPFGINTTTGRIGAVYVTATSYFVIRGATAGSWQVGYVSNVSRPDSIQTSGNNGNAWTNFSGTVDAHLHQYDGTDALYYYACANDTSANGNCSAVSYDLIQLGGIRPSAPSVSAPLGSVYGATVSINYSAAQSPNGYPITLYNVTLANPDLSYNKTIVANNSPNLSYAWSSTGSSDGEYVVNVTACDSQGLCSAGLSENFTLDNSVPSLFVSSPSNNSAHNSTVYLNYSASDAYLASSWYSLNAGANTTLSGNTSLSSLAQGWNTLTVYANDSVGNTNSSGQIQFFFDNQPPQLDFTLATNGSGYYNSAQLVNFSASDANTSVIIVYVNGVQNNYCAGASALLYCAVALSSEGSFNVSAWTNDSSTNSNTTLNRTYVLDFTAPVIVVTSPSNNSAYNSSVSLNYSVIETNANASWIVLNAVANYSQGNRSLTGLAQGWNNLTVYANDSAGNQNNSGQIQFFYDSAAPQVDFAGNANSSGYYNSSITVNFTVSDANLSSVLIYVNGAVQESCLGNATTHCNLSISAAGAYNVSAYAVDGAGSTNTTSNRSYVVDYTLPQIIVASPANNSWHSSSTVALSTQVVEQYLNASWYVLDGAAPVYVGNASLSLADGAHNLTFYANDSAGNSNSSGLIAFYADASAPAIDFDSTASAAGFTNQSVLVNFTASDLNLSSIIIYVNGVVNTTCTSSPCNLTISAEGNYSVFGWANDSVGHNNQTSVRNYSIDFTAPNLSIIAPINNSFTSSTTATLTYHVSDAYLASTWYVLDGGSAHLLTGNASLSGLSQATHSLVLYANDSAGNLNSSAISFTVDSIAPAITVSVPTNGLSYLTATPSLSFQVVDANLNATWFVLDGAANYTSGNVSLTAAQGWNQLVVFANDSAGNQNQTSQISFYVDSQAPQFTHNSSNNTAHNQTTLLSAHCNDNLALGSAWLSTNNSGIWVNSTPVALGGTLAWSNISITLNASVGVEVQWRIYANDSLGNLNSTEIATITTTNTLPALLATPLLSNYTPSETDSITCSPGTYRDADGDAQQGTFYLWLMNGTEIATGASITLSDYAAQTNDNFSCSVAVFDGFGNSSWFNSSNATVGATPDLTPPTYSELSVSNTQHNQTTLLSALWNDGAGVGFLNGSILSTNNSGSWTNSSFTSFAGNGWSNYSITLNATSGLTVAWRIYAVDLNNNWNATEEQTLATANTPPVLQTNPSIAQGVAYKFDSINCVSGQYFDANGDAESQSFWQWHKNGVILSGNESQTLSLELVGAVEADNFSCSQLVYDGYENSSSWYNSSNLTISSQLIPPVLSVPAVSSITTSSAIVSWTTDVAANSIIYYGIGTGNHSSYLSNAANQTSHSLSLSALSANTDYYYLVSSCDRYGNCVNQSELNFTTIEESNPTPTPTPTAAPQGGTGGATQIVGARDAQGNEVGESGVRIITGSEREQVLSWIAPSDLGLTGSEFGSNVHVEQYGQTLSETTTVSTAKVFDTLPLATDPVAQDFLAQLHQGLDAGNRDALEITTTITQYEADAGAARQARITLVTLSFTAKRDGKEVRIIQVLPKSVAQSVSELVFQGAMPRILQDDPIFEWTFDSVKQGQEVAVSYVVKKPLYSIDFQSMAIQNASPITTPTATSTSAPESTASPTAKPTVVPASLQSEQGFNYWWLLPLVIALVVFFLLKRGRRHKPGLLRFEHPARGLHR